MWKALRAYFDGKGQCSATPDVIYAVVVYHGDAVAARVQFGDKAAAEAYFNAVVATGEDPVTRDSARAVAWQATMHAGDKLLASWRAVHE